ncbi:hybrid sensor histidine kinase/response regulator [Desulfogranum japonicum]|uniref:hybrid sensor histidine kinase/response regulator n=1 Tax=Desulfogranum japonicum TaxID=231447 RepID=UPI000401F4B2|nr:PAS domain S-box protein [Desulfogranum japonicum]
MAIWVALLTSSFILYWRETYSTALQLASQVADSHFNKDLAYRRWATLHGGLYVPPTSDSPPNPYLAEITDRDIETTDGKQLTLINPAYMTRQVFELSQEQYGVRAHITSLLPLRPENKPDDWEKKALYAFESGAKEFSSLESINGKPYLRYMRPMITEAGCLKCHGYQKYKVGDVRGGISVSVLFTPYLEKTKNQQRLTLLIHLAIGSFGLLGIWLFGHLEYSSHASLQESQQRLSFVMKASDMGPWDWNLLTDEVLFSPEWKRQIGYEENEISNQYKEWEKRLHPDDLERVLSTLKAHFEDSENGYNVIFRLRHKDGSYRWIESKGITLKDKSGKPYRMLGCHLDITAKKEREDAVRQTALEWSAATDASNDALYILDIDRHLLRANKVFYQMMGCSPETTIGKHIEEIIHPAGESTPCAICRAQKELRDTILRMEPDDPNNPTGKPIEVTLTIVRGENELPIRIFMRIQDLTEQREVEYSLRKSQEQWEKTFNAIDDIVTILDTDMKIVKINRAGFEALGLSSNDIIGRHCHELFADLKKACPKCPILKTKRTFEPYSKEVTHEKLGKTFLVSAAAILDTEKNLTHIVHTAKDITEKKKIEAELLQAQKMEAIGTLAGGIAHDFNNILTSILGYAELAKSSAPVKSELSKDIDQVLRATQRAIDLVRHILSFSRKADYSLKPLEPHLIIKEALKMMRASIPSSIRIQEEIDDHCGWIMADPTSIHQIIINLCTNAQHAMEREKGILSIRLYRQAVTQEDLRGEQDGSIGQFIVLEVSDTGNGIEPKILERIFDPYFTTKEDGKGTGLGLAVIHGKVKDFQGFIRVKSKVGQGSTFSMYFPALESHINNQIPTAPEGPIPKGTERVLVVDDEEAIANLTKVTLEKLGYTVTAFTSGMEALKKLRENADQFDVVITDQTMPGMNGGELAKEILKIRPDMPIILCTGYSSILSKEEAIAIGIRKYLKKPLQRKELAQACRELLDNTVTNV